MNGRQLELLLAYIDEAIRLNGHSHEGAGGWAHSAGVGNKPEINKLKHELREAVFHAGSGETYDGTFTRIGD